MVVNRDKIKELVAPVCSWRTKQEFRDRKYRLYTWETIEKEILLLPKTPKIEPEFFDCDDTADWILCHLKAKLRGVAAFYVKGIDTKARPKKAHAWVGVIDLTGHIHSIDVRPVYGGGIVGVSDTLFTKYPKIERVRF